MWKKGWHLKVSVVVFVLVSVGIGEVMPTPLSHQQQLRRRGIARARIGTVTAPVSAEPQVSETTEPILVEYTATQVAEREKHMKAYEKAMKARESELENIKSAFIEREKVLEEREYALDIRDADLDQRSNNIDKQILETDKRLKDREDRIAAREKALTEREMEVLKLAEAREQEIDRLSREREQALELREKALEDRELALAEREKKVEEREIRVQKRMENNRKRFQRRMELRQLDQRVGVVSSSTPRARSLDFSSIDPLTQATTNHPRRVIEKVTFRKVTSSSPSVSETTVYIPDNARDGSVTASLSPDEQTQVTEAVSYESAKEYSTLASTIIQKGDGSYVGVADNTLAVSSTGKKRKSGKRRARQRRQHHHRNDNNQEESTTTISRRSRTKSSSSTSSHRPEEEEHKAQKKQRKVRKVVKKMGSDGTMVIIKHEH